LFARDKPTYVWHDSFICDTWLIHNTRAYTWRDSFICNMTLWRRETARLDSFSCVMWLVHMCKVTRSYVWLDSFISDMTMTTGDCTWHDTFTCMNETWLNHMCDVNHSYVWRDLTNTCDVTGICPDHVWALLFGPCCLGQADVAPPGRDGGMGFQRRQLFLFNLCSFAFGFEYSTVGRHVAWHGLQFARTCWH